MSPPPPPIPSAWSLLRDFWQTRNENPIFIHHQRHRRTIPFAPLAGITLVLSLLPPCFATYSLMTEMAGSTYYLSNVRHVLVLFGSILSFPAVILPVLLFWKGRLFFDPQVQEELLLTGYPAHRFALGTLWPAQSMTALWVIVALGGTSIVLVVSFFLLPDHGETTRALCTVVMAFLLSAVAAGIMQMKIYLFIWSRKILILLIGPLLTVLMFTVFFFMGTKISELVHGTDWLVGIILCLIGAILTLGETKTLLRYTPTVFLRRVAMQPFLSQTVIAQEGLKHYRKELRQKVRMAFSQLPSSPFARQVLILSISAGIAFLFSQYLISKEGPDGIKLFRFGGMHVVLLGLAVALFADVGLIGFRAVKVPIVVGAAVTSFRKRFSLYLVAASVAAVLVAIATNPRLDNRLSEAFFNVASILLVVQVTIFLLSVRLVWRTVFLFLALLFFVDLVAWTFTDRLYDYRALLVLVLLFALWSSIPVWQNFFERHLRTHEIGDRVEFVVHPLREIEERKLD